MDVSFNSAKLFNYPKVYMNETNNLQNRIMKEEDLGYENILKSQNNSDYNICVKK